MSTADNNSLLITLKDLNTYGTPLAISFYEMSTAGAHIVAGKFKITAYGMDFLFNCGVQGNAVVASVQTATGAVVTYATEALTKRALQVVCQRAVTAAFVAGGVALGVATAPLLAVAGVSSPVRETVSK